MANINKIENGYGVINIIRYGFCNMRLNAFNNKLTKVRKFKVVAIRKDTGEMIDKYCYGKDQLDYFVSTCLKWLQEDTQNVNVG